MVLTRTSAARPNSLDLDNALPTDMESVFPDMDNNNLHPSSATRNSRKKRRRADMPIKKFIGKFSFVVFSAVYCFNFTFQMQWIISFIISIFVKSGVTVGFKLIFIILKLRTEFHTYITCNCKIKIGRLEFEMVYGIDHSFTNDTSYEQ